VADGLHPQSFVTARVDALNDGAPRRNVLDVDRSDQKQIPVEFLHDLRKVRCQGPFPVVETEEPVLNCIASIGCALCGRRDLVGPLQGLVAGAGDSRGSGGGRGALDVAAELLAAAAVCATLAAVFGLTRGASLSLSLFRIKALLEEEEGWGAAVAAAAAAAAVDFASGKAFAAPSPTSEVWPLGGKAMAIFLLSGFFLSNSAFAAVDLWV